MPETEEFLMEILHVEANYKGHWGPKKTDPPLENYPELWEVNKRCLAEFH